MASNNINGWVVTDAQAWNAGTSLETNMDQMAKSGTSGDLSRILRSGNLMRESQVGYDAVDKTSDEAKKSADKNFQ